MKGVFIYENGDMKKQYGLILAVSLFFLTLFSCHGHVYADTGPKPSININISGLQGEKYYMALLSKEKGTGPWSVNRGYEAHYGDEDIWQRFSTYNDTDGYYFIGNFKECSETNSFSWTYYPPENFKILIYVPSHDKFIVRSDHYERYAFHSYYDIEVSLNNSTIEVAKFYSYAKEIIAFALRMVICIIIELFVAYLFGFKRKIYLLIIVITNIITQIFLNGTLQFLVYKIGPWGLNFSAYFSLEIMIFVIEAICYNIMLYKRTSEKRLHPWVYSLTANSISLILGLILSMIVPSIF